MEGTTKPKYFIWYTLALAVANLISSLLFDYKLFFMSIIISFIIIAIIYFMFIKEEKKSTGDIKNIKTTLGILTVFSFGYFIFYFVGFILRINNETFEYLKFIPFSNLFSIVTIIVASIRLIIKK